MDPIYWAAAVSFVIGACGYIIVRFWLIPIIRYKRVKKKLHAGLKAFSQKLTLRQAEKSKAVSEKKRCRDLRRLGMKLVKVHDAELPYWYRLVMVTRKESPLAASASLMRLENLPTIEQAGQCIEDVGLHLNFKRQDKMNRFGRFRNTLRSLFWQL